MIRSQADSDLSLDDYLKKQEKFFIESVLSTQKDLDKTCEKLKISKSNLYKKIKDLGISYE
jgi:transcriptional regulator with PAS, ATPase and Fis domain